MNVQIKPGVCVVVPARNAGAVLPRALQSLVAQSYTNWEAWVVDDGSTDDTADVAERFCRADPRFGLIRQPHGGVSRARNAGMSKTRREWLLFLDADDEILPGHLERLSGILENDATLQAAVCRWTEIGPAGTARTRLDSWPAEEWFARLVRGCAFAIHACLIRTDAVRRAGGFDEEYAICEDWDLWQRIARTGARLAQIPDVLAVYYLRAGAASIDPTVLCRNGLRVIRTGHGRDIRVPNSHPKFAEGAPGEGLLSASQNFAAVCVGQSLALEHEDPFLNELMADLCSSVDPRTIAECLAEGVITGAVANPPEGEGAWNALASHINAFFRDLSQPLRTPRFLRICAARMGGLLLSELPALGHLSLGEVEAVGIDAAAGLPQIRTGDASRLVCVVDFAGERLGLLTLPAVDGRVSRLVVADETASRFAWQILGCFFRQTVYRERPVTEDSGQPVEMVGADLHDRIGWLVFLQEFFGKPDWPEGRFYDSSPPASAAGLESADGVVEIECTGDLPALEAGANGATVVFRVGGAAVTSTRLQPGEIISSDQLRCKLLEATGFELCRVAVREGVIGRPTDGISLRVRLQNAAARQAVVPWHTEDGPALLIPAPPRTGTGAARRIAVPLEAATAAAESCGSEIAPGVGGPAASIALVCADVLHPDHSATHPAATPTAVSAPATSPYGRAYFEHLFCRDEDPWKYDNDYERVKYEQTLELLPQDVTNALELACAEGHFTARLAPIIPALTAADISEIALERAARRCAGSSNVHFAQLDFLNGPIPGVWDLIVCSEVLYFARDASHLQEIALKLAGALRPGGWLLTAHADQAIDGSGEPCFDWGLPFGALRIGEILAGSGRLQLAREIRTPLYRVQLFQADAERKAPAEIRLAATADPLPSNIASMIRRNAAPAYVPTECVTRTMPILMYHRVSPSQAGAASRYCVTPAQLAKQLQYLRDSGHYTASLEAWRAAAESRRPLPGRAVILTFDDGYRDFLDHAMPLLVEYGFSAMVFLVSGLVGKTNEWDRDLETVPLLGWPEIRQLQESGIVFGGHSCGHPSLLDLTLSEVVREAGGTRTEIARNLGVSPDSFAYPYGDHDGAVEQMVAACGYTFGLTCRTARARFQDSMLALPRIEIEGKDALPDFVLKLHQGDPVSTT